MNKDEIISRLYELNISLQFCSQARPMFTRGERIMINQERCQLIHKLDYPKSIVTPVSEVIEEKIAQIKRLVPIYNWSPLYKQTDFTKVKQQNY